jgi:hypothetical protein
MQKDTETSSQSEDKFFTTLTYSGNAHFGFDEFVTHRKLY